MVQPKISRSVKEFELWCKNGVRSVQKSDNHAWTFANNGKSAESFAFLQHFDSLTLAGL